MNTSQVRLLAGLSALLLGLSLLLYLWEPTGVTRDPRATSQVVEALDPTLAVALRITQSGGERDAIITLIKADGVWNVVEPYQAPADPDRVIAILDAVRESERGVPVPGEKRSFGLEPPQAVVVVTMQDGTERELTVGNAAPVGFRTYVLAADGSIAAVSGTPGEQLLQREGEYRDHKIFRYDPGAVTRVSVLSGGGLLEATKTPEGWFLTGFGPVDLNQLDAWITGLLNLRVDLFLDLEHTKIADPRYTVEVETAEGVQRMWVGDDTPYGPLVFFGPDLDGVVDPSLLAQLERRPSAVGAPGAFPFDPNEHTAIVLSGAVERRIERGEAWNGGDEVRAVATAGLVYVGSDGITLPSIPWTGPELTVTIEGPDGERSVEIGPVVGDFRAVRDIGWPTAVRAPAEEVEALFR